jgi:GNAT superfamily N-acetyltransferase
VIRPAIRGDARAIAELEVRAWRWAFGDLVDEGDMPTVAARRARWTTRPLDGAHVAELAGRVVGVVQVGPSADEPGTGRLRGHYVDPAAQGAGVGGRLHDHALAALRDAGFAVATLWVFAANGQAREFYAARGWAPDGGRAEWAGVSELRYRRTLLA